VVVSWKRLRTPPGTFNVENLFSRPEVMNLGTWAEGRPILNDVARLNGLLARQVYTPAVKHSIEAILDKYEFGNRNIRHRPFVIVEVRDKLYNAVRTHIHDGGATRIFSRDCPEFEVLLPDGTSLWVLGNHFKSKGYGNPAENDERRRRQAEAVADIYAHALPRSPYVAVVGDLNDFPASAPLAALIDATDLRDVMTHPSYAGSPGTYKTG
jgi:hypothetical protein